MDITVHLTITVIVVLLFPQDVTILNNVVTDIIVPLTVSVIMEVLIQAVGVQAAIHALMENTVPLTVPVIRDQHHLIMLEFHVVQMLIVLMDITVHPIIYVMLMHLQEVVS